MYQMPKIMVPVRTWQQRQQLVEYQRSHGEIILKCSSREPETSTNLHECCRGWPDGVFKSTMTSTAQQVELVVTSNVCRAR